MNCVFSRRRFKALSIALSDLMADITNVDCVGSNEQISAMIYMPFTSVPSTGVCYLLSVCNGYMGVWKIKDGTLITTPIKQMSTSYGGIHMRTGYGYYYKSGVYSSGSGTANATNIYGGTLALVRFPSYSEAEIDNTFASATYTTLAGRNDNSTGIISTADKSYPYYLCFFANRYEVWSCNGTNWSNDYKNASSASFGSNGSTLAYKGYAYGASIIGLT